MIVESPAVGLRRVGPAALALVLSSVVLLVGWRGVDQAAQVYRTTQFQLHGLQLWDSGWYAGNSPLGYSVLFPALAATAGTGLVIAAAAVLATWSFDQLVRDHLGGRPIGTWYFAVSIVANVVIGQWPYLAGEACGLAALVGLARRRRVPALLPALLTGLFSPLAAGYLALACAAWAAGSGADSPPRRGLIATALLAVATVAILSLAFPGDGPFPDSWTSFAGTLLICLCALTPLVRTPPAIRVGAVIYGALSIVSFVVPNPVGGVGSRLATSVGVPLLLCFATADRRYLARAAVIAFAAWQWSPATTWVSGATAYARAGFYQPLIAELHHVAAGPARIEVVPTAQHWESAYVAPAFPIARGWERQLDTVDDPIFYRPGLSGPSYEAWLAAEGVSYVALPSAPLDYASRAEAALLRSGQVPGLRMVWSDPDWKLWQVTFGPGLTSGPGVLTALEPGHVTIQASAAGKITVRVRYTKFWSVTSGAACVTGAAGATDRPYQWTSVTALGPGRIELSATLMHHDVGPGCPSP